MGYKLNGIYVGADKVRPPVPPIPYLCFTANTAGSTVQLIKNGNPASVSLETSTDKSTRTDYTIGDTITLSNIGDKIYWRNKSETATSFSTGGSNYYQFVMSGSISSDGDINYLLCKNSTDTLTSNYCYRSLFFNCSALTTAPELPATTLTEFCYYNMFDKCVNLETLTALPATIFPNQCCCYMFSRCSKIKVSTTQTGEYQNAYRIPTTGTGTDPGGYGLYVMFTSTGGTFTGTPSINTTYYTSNTIV